MGELCINVKATDTNGIRSVNLHLNGMLLNPPVKENSACIWSPADDHLLNSLELGFIDQASKSDEPFFMYIAFNAPHDPRQSPKEFVDMYPVESIAVPDNFLPEYPYNEHIGSGKTLRDEKLAPFPRTEYSIKVNRAEYYALITHMDEQIGKILNALENSGKLENTYIFFTADHGLAVGHHGLMGKQSMYEHSLAAPLIVAGPGIENGKSLKQRVYIQDIVPSTLELAGIEQPEFIDFQSIMPLVKGEQKTGRKVIYGAYRDLQRCLIKGDWKIIYYPEIAKYRLFNLQDDPGEMNDLIGAPEYSSLVEELKQDLQEEMKKQDDPLIKS